MDLIAWLVRCAPVRPLLVTVPGGTRARLAVEFSVRRRGWRLAASPAEANLLVVCGPWDDGAGSIGAAVDLVADQLPFPRARVDVRTGEDVEHRLDAALDRLHDVDGQRLEAADPGRAALPGHPRPVHDMTGMEMPGGVSMAERAPDRDGLKLDVLNIVLGPVLPDWPPGLVVRAAMQGDVLSRIVVETTGLPRSDLPHRRGPAPRPNRYATATEGGAARHRVAARLDSVGRLLAVLSWEDPAARARLCRDRLLGGDGPGPELGRLVRQVRRSRTLRWSTDGVGVVPAGHGPLSGDVTGRLRRWLDDIEDGLGRLDDTAPLVGAAPEAELPTVLAMLREVLEGAELAAARIVVASLDPEMDAAARTPETVVAQHG